MKNLLCMLGLAVVGLTGCQSAEPVGTQGGSALPPGISEADFQALHQLSEQERPPLHGEMVAVGGGEAYLALPASRLPPVPAVLLIHEWWGLNEHVKHWADRLAAEGYAALAVDLYGGQVATTREDALANMQAVQPEAALAMLQAGYEFLAQDERVRAPRRVTMGWCFGGHWSLQHAIHTPDLDGAVIYYGRLITDPEALQSIQCPIVGIFGNQDQGIPPAAVDEWLEAMSVTDVDVDVHRFDAPHAFANPSNARYDAEAAEAAWKKVRAFLADRLQ